MDKSEVKRTLKAQVEPMSQAVEKKLAYLQSDNVFTETAPQTSNSDNSLLDAFSDLEQKPSAITYNQPNTRELYKSIQSAIQPEYVEKAPTQKTVEEHKQNIAAKIAALRGISMPGDYLRNKK